MVIQEYRNIKVTVTGGINIRDSGRGTLRILRILGIIRVLLGTKDTGDTNGLGTIGIWGSVTRYRTREYGYYGY